MAMTSLKFFPAVFIVRFLGDTGQVFLMVMFWDALREFSMQDSGLLRETMDERYMQL